VFLTDSDVEQMTGCKQGKHYPVKLKRWLVDHGYVEDVTFFKRVDGWYSVMSPQARATSPDRPRLRIPA
jgi:hypothetical protein